MWAKTLRDVFAGSVTNPILLSIIFQDPRRFRGHRPRLQKIRFLILWVRTVPCHVASFALLLWAAPDLN
jgi:hypothetical protein